MAQKNRVLAVPLTSFLGSSLTTGYQAINAVGFSNPCFAIRIVNSSSLAILISYDGTTSHEMIPVGGVFELSTQSNASLSSMTALFPVGQHVYVKSTGAGTGTIYLSAYYQVV